MTDIDPTIDSDLSTVKLPQPGDHVYGQNEVYTTIGGLSALLTKKTKPPLAQSVAEPAVRYDADKMPFADFDTFFDEGFAAEIGAALRYGSAKYGKDNWKKGMSWHRCLNSCRRHLLAFWKGEKTDRESGIHHLALAVCSIMFLFAYERDNIGKDTR